MAIYTNISRWKKQIHLHTLGTRDKFIVISPNDSKYYFKSSINKGTQNYIYEFWSEIIASEIGDLLGFDVIPYSIASFGSTIGCMSKSIIDENNEEHHPGYQFIYPVFPDFATNFKKTHSFQKIIKSLQKADLLDFSPKVIDMIIFDSIIGNSDRHSENWAVVVRTDKIFQELHESLLFYNKSNIFYKLISNLYFIFKLQITYKSLKKEIKKKQFRFSPLFDNGSSLGRHLTEERVNVLSSDDNEMLKFTKKRKPDIRWNELNLNHQSLIEKIKEDPLNPTHNDIVLSVLRRIESKYNYDKLANIVNSIDENLPFKFKEYKIPQKRKDFIIKFVDLRIKQILELL